MLWPLTTVTNRYCCNCCC